MSREGKVEVVRIGKIGQHPNADSLSLTQIHGGYPVIMRTGNFNEGDLAVYVPVDSMVPRTPEFEFLFDPDKDNERQRVKAKKLRGIFSMGLLVPVPHALDNPVEGMDLTTALDITKYEPPVNFRNEDQVPAPALIVQPPYYDIEGLRRYGDIFQLDERVVITEKIHGANMRAVWWNDEFHVGGRTQWLKADGFSPYAMALQNDKNLQDMLKDNPGLVVFGEVYGKVQNLRYGLENSVSFRAFDVFNSNDGQWFDYEHFSSLCSFYVVMTVPVLYDGPWKGVEAHADLAEGNTTLGADHVREGFVVRPLMERWDATIGRVVLKLHGEGYLTSKHN